MLLRETESPPDGTVFISGGTTGLWQRAPVPGKYPSMIPPTSLRLPLHRDNPFFGDHRGKGLSPRASLNGFKGAGPLVTDAKNDLALVGAVYAEFIIHF